MGELKVLGLRISKYELVKMCHTHGHIKQNPCSTYCWPNVCGLWKQLGNGKVRNGWVDNYKTPLIGSVFEQDSDQLTFRQTLRLRW